MKNCIPPINVTSHKQMIQKKVKPCARMTSLASISLSTVCFMAYMVNAVLKGGKCWTNFIVLVVLHTLSLLTQKSRPSMSYRGCAATNTNEERTYCESCSSIRVSNDLIKLYLHRGYLYNANQLLQTHTDDKIRFLRKPLHHN